MATTKSTKKSTKQSTKKTVKKAASRPAKKTAARPARRSSPDAIALLKQDHREVEQLFKRFEKAGDGALEEKGRLAASMIEALSRHAAIEEMVFYPAVRREVPRQAATVLESLEEHHIVKWLLTELEDLDPAAERFNAKVTVLMESVRHHVREEEDELFPKVRTTIARARLTELGDELRAAKRGAPARPHPRSPDTPPANVMVGGAVAVMDKARELGKRAVDRVRDDITAI